MIPASVFVSALKKVLTLDLYFFLPSPLLSSFLSPLSSPPSPPLPSFDGSLALNYQLPNSLWFILSTFPIDLTSILYTYFIGILSIGSDIQKGPLEKVFFFFSQAMGWILVENADGIGGRGPWGADIWGFCYSSHLSFGCFRFGPCGQTHTWVTTI